MNTNLPTYQAETWETRINHYRYWFLDLFLILVLAGGGYFRFVGISWDGDQHLHPDERFLTMVENNMTPVESLGDYFNTDLSTLNPHNVGHSFYVYGDFPIIFTRYIAEWTDQTTYDTVNVLGRQISASFDLLTILMVFLIGKKLYDRRIGLLASAFYSLAVIPIQLSHFFAVDTFAVFLCERRDLRSHQHLTVCTGTKNGITLISRYSVQTPGRELGTTSFWCRACVGNGIQSKHCAAGNIAAPWRILLVYPLTG